MFKMQTMFYGSGEIDQQLRGRTNSILFSASTSGDVQQPKTLVSGDYTPSSEHHGHGYNVHMCVRTHTCTHTPRTYIKFLIKITFYKSLLLKIR